MNKNNLNPSKNDQILNNLEFIPEKLDILGGAFATIGDFLSTLATILALDELIVAKKEEQQNATILEEKLINMQKEIDDLKLKLNNLNKSTSAQL